MTCATCGQAIRPARHPKAEEQADVATMTDTKLFAWYRTTAPVEDARFYLRVLNGTLAPGLRGELERLIVQLPARTEFYRKLAAVMAQWRAGRERPEPRKGEGSGFGVWLDSRGQEISASARDTRRQDAADADAREREAVLS